MVENAIVRVGAPFGRRVLPADCALIAELSLDVYEASLARFFPPPKERFRICWPGWTAVSSFTHPTGAWLKAPVIHLHGPVDAKSSVMRRHLVAELTHAFHFERLPKRKRVEITARYGMELAAASVSGMRKGDGVRSWSAGEELGPVTAFVEALDLFVSAYDSLRETTERDDCTRSYLRELTVGAPLGERVPARVAAAIFADSFESAKEATSAYVDSGVVTWREFVRLMDDSRLRAAAELHSLGA